MSMSICDVPNCNEASGTLTDEEKEWGIHVCSGHYHQLCDLGREEREDKMANLGLEVETRPLCANCDKNGVPDGDYLCADCRKTRWRISVPKVDLDNLPNHQAKEVTAFLIDHDIPFSIAVEGNG